MRKVISIFILLILFSAIVGWWINDGADTQHVPKSTGLTKAPAVQAPKDPLGAKLSEQAAEPEALQSPTFARKITHVPPGKSDSDTAESFLNDINAANAENLDRFTRHNLESALSGDLGAGLRVSQARKLCLRRPRSIEEIERRIAMRHEAVQHMRDSGEAYPVSGGFRFKNDYPTEAEIRSDEEGWRNACRLHAGFFNDELRKRLDQLAQQGHVVARYLYATWPPNYLASAEGFFLQQEWETKSREYSLLNLDEGEVAGLLAFGESYAGSSLFTRHESHLSHALYMAAIDCGFTDPGLQSRVDSYLESELSPAKLNSSAPEVLAIAAKLTNYCH